MRGLSALQAGLVTLPMAAMSALLPPIAGRIVGRRGPRIPLVAGGAGIAAGSALLFLTLDDATPLPMIVAAFVVFGAGFGLINPPITNAAVSGMPVTQAGVAAAVASTSRQVGSALGVAVIGTLVTSRIAGGMATGFVPAAQVGWAVMTACGLAVAVLGLVTTGKRARRSAERTATALQPAGV